jgi:site-specific DNA recombinase
MSKTAAFYARVSSDQQRQEQTILSQTAALLEYGQSHQYVVPPEWRFEDNGYSGATLVRPALERLRDLIAEGAIERLLVYSPDRLSRNYAYQVLLLEEFARHGAEVVFVQAPAADTPEQRLMLQFQGMIAEYERAQIAERCRRGKRCRAKAGLVNVLSSKAPYGYRYVKKTEQAQAYYEVLEREASWVREIFRRYTLEGQSIRGLTDWLNQEPAPTRSRTAGWVAATVWGILTNSAYRGRAYYGKTQPGPPTQRMTRVSRLKGPYPRHVPSKRRRPPEEWIEIAVPALVSEETFGLAQDRLQLSKKFSPRRTRLPTLLQGLLVCEHCGYALCRSGGGNHGGKRLYYYRCLGLDRGSANGPVCRARPVRVEQLDQLIWEQIWQWLNRPELIQQEIERRLQEIHQSSPLEQRQAEVSKELARVEQQTDKLIDAYQEGLIDLAELRSRIPEIKKRQTALDNEQQSLSLQAVQQTRLTEVNLSIERFSKQLLRAEASLDILQKQRIIRLLVREVVVGTNTVTIHHGIPLLEQGMDQKLPNYRLCMGRDIVPSQCLQGFGEGGAVTRGVTIRDSP